MHALSPAVAAGHGVSVNAHLAVKRRPLATGLQPPRACARAMTILLGPPPVHRGAFIGSRPAWARPSGQKVCRQATRGHLPASSPFQSVTASQPAETLGFLNFSLVTTEHGVTLLKFLK